MEVSKKNANKDEHHWLPPSVTYLGVSPPLPYIKAFPHHENGKYIYIREDLCDQAALCDLFDELMPPSDESVKKMGLAKLK